MICFDSPSGLATTERDPAACRIARILRKAVAGKRVASDGAILRAAVRSGISKRGQSQTAAAIVAEDIPRNARVLDTTLQPVKHTIAKCIFADCPGVRRRKRTESASAQVHAGLAIANRVP